MKTIRELQDSLPRRGRIEWIGKRPSRREAVIGVENVELIPGAGLDGDHRASRKPNPENSRQVTLIQWEHLPVIAALIGWEAVEPALFRRNIAVSGINLIALKRKRFRIGETELEGSGNCPPCSRMEEILGPGGYNAMRGHGGITARVVAGGRISLGDRVFLEA